MRSIIVLILTTLFVTCFVFLADNYGSNISDNPNNDYCKSYYDSLLNVQVYINYDIEPTLKKGNNITNIMRKIQIPKNRYDDTGEYIDVHSISLVVIIDSVGEMLSYKIKNKEEHSYDAFEKIVIRTIDCHYNNEILWNPAKCNGKNVTVKQYIPFIF